MKLSHHIPIHETPFLLPTTYCDSEHPEIKKLAAEIASTSRSQLHYDVADAVRTWIRNNVRYMLDFTHTKASETLQKREGMCTNKANLQIAILRALHIPAGYGVVKITKRVYQHSADPELYKKISEPTTHVFACVYLTRDQIPAARNTDNASDQSSSSSSEPAVAVSTNGCTGEEVRNETGACEDRFYYFDATVSENDSLYLEHLPTGETKYKDEWLLGTIQIHSNLDHMLMMPSRYTREELEILNQFYRTNRDSM